MSTKTLLYPFGFEEVDVLPGLDDNRPNYTSFVDAMALYFVPAYTTYALSITIVDGDGPGTPAIINFSSLPGWRTDYSGGFITYTEPRKLIGQTKKYDGITEFAAPYHYDDQFVPSTTTYGGDKTYSARFTFKGNLFFNSVANVALPIMTGSVGVSCDGNGATFGFSFQEPGTTPKFFVPALNFNGVPLNIWFFYNLNGFGASASGTLTVTTTQPFVWP